MGRYAKAVAAVLIGLMCINAALSRSFETDFEQRQLSAVLPAWLARLKDNLPTVLNTRVDYVSF